MGAFIKPDQEKKACNGQRALCMCSKFMAKQAAKNAGKKVYKGSGAAQKLKDGPGGASHHYLLSQMKDRIQRLVSSYPQDFSLQYSLLVIRTIDHVPKILVRKTII